MKQVGPRTGRARGFRKLIGLDRSGDDPLETVRGQPLNPWTVPNFIGYARFACLVPFLVIAFQSGDGRTPAAAVLAGIIGFGDYFDGIAARLTGQYSRMGALLDPLTDRLTVLAGGSVCYYFELLPRWALAVLAVRELVMLILARIVLSQGRDIHIRWIGRAAVWPTMGSLFVAMLVDTWTSDALLYVGLAASVAATLEYIVAEWQSRTATLKHW